MYVCLRLLLVCYAKKEHLRRVQGWIYCEANEAWASGPPLAWTPSKSLWMTPKVH
jgi:hypothetical protein